MLTAVATVSQRAAGRRAADQLRLETAVGGAADVRQLADRVRATSRLTLNFHPDRLTADGLAVAEALRHGGRYLPQSQTGISNGGRFPARSSLRTAWEAKLFGGAYDDGRHDGAAPMIRPVYGALDLTRDPHGACPRFGSSFVVLADHCVDRATFCVGDSHTLPGHPGPTDLGTASEFTGILAGLFEQGVAGIGLQRGLTVTALLGLLDEDPYEPAPARCLDGYIEAQVHGGVELGRDVDGIVLDPSFKGTNVAQSLENAARAYGFELDWHRGSELAADDVPADFRGPTMPKLARRLARTDGIVDAAAIGREAAMIPWSEPRVDGDPTDGPRQQVKYLWHCLLRFGHDAHPPDPPPAI